MFIDKEICSISDAISALKEVYNSTPELWFRGHTTANWKLQPSAYRDDYTFGDEFSRYLQFIVKAKSRYPNCPHENDFMGWLQLMRHYGLKTRLLDWSRSPLVALFFAIEKKQDDENGILWICKPYLLNHRSLNRIHAVIVSYRDHTTSPVYHCLENAFNPSCRENNPSDFYAIYPHETDTRITNQQSTFTLHGNETPLEDHPNASEILGRLYFTPKNRINLISELSILAVDKTYLFPDLEHLAYEINKNLFRERV